ncbi:WRKY transcription factor 55-like [Hordeum vulgare subsp. vulgare]|uniref:WRKY domain-containing protein n=2 Tax=Hordeum vulgare subsp. vulgare TaxID=112509 RepID=A0A8I7B6Z9_HORVV|nr:WRKY transcription factor 55-like [Hordeum vulgare subsp. vulgare]
MALDSVPSYPSDLGSSSSRTTRTQQRIRKEERTWTADTYAPYDDGHQWRKYGEKKLSNSNFPRFYYRCTYKTDLKCPATKQVQQKDMSDPPLFTVTYFNHHSCNTTSRPIGSAPDTTEQSSSRRAVSICFGSHATGEQPTFLTSPGTLQSPASTTNQQSDIGAYGHQFQWTDTSPSADDAPVKMETDSLAGTGASSGGASGHALSRTLLPIGQSRCIEYFHFL